MLLYPVYWVGMGIDIEHLGRNGYYHFPRIMIKAFFSIISSAMMGIALYI
jgi:hypothetical protein